MKQCLGTFVSVSLVGSKTIFTSLDRETTKFYEYHIKDMDPNREFVTEFF